MLDKIAQIFKIKELRNKILYVAGLLVVFRLAAHIFIPGVDVNQIKAASAGGGDQLLALLSIFTGGGMFSVVMMGVGPYITASIIMQLLTMIFPQIKEIYHESGEAGRQKFNQYTRILAVPMSLLQGYGMITLLKSKGLISALSPDVLITALVTVTAGTIFLMWLGELISEKNIGNGISLIIFAGIVSRIPADIISSYSDLTSNPGDIPSYAVMLAISVIVILGVVFITEAQRNIQVTYAKRVRGGRMFGGSSTYLPIRVNSAGMIPIIFAMSIMLFPGIIAQMLSNSNITWLSKMAASASLFFQNQSTQISLSFILVVLFTYFYTAIVFEPHAVSENLQKHGGFIPGIRPGKPTEEFLSKVVNRITLAGSLFLGVIAVLPFIAQSASNISTIAVGGASVLIVVGVVLDIMRQISAQLSMRDYEKF